MSDLIAQMQKAMDASPFIRTCGLKLVDLDLEAGTLAMAMPYAEALGRAPEGRQFHGGAIAALIDTAGTLAVAAQTQTPIPTIEFRVDFLRPAIDTDLMAKSRIRRSGKTVSVVDVEVENNDGVQIALGRGVFGSGKK